MLAYKMAALLYEPIAAVDPHTAEQVAQVLQQAMHQDKTAIMVISYVMLGVIVALVSIAWWAVHVHARLAVGNERLDAIRSIEVSLDRNLSIMESILRLQTHLLMNCSKCNPEVIDALLSETSTHVEAQKRRAQKAAATI